MDTSKFKPFLVGFARAVGCAAVYSGLTFLGSAEHLTFLNPAVAAAVSALILGWEHSLEAEKGTALFGAVKTR